MKTPTISENRRSCSIHASSSEAYIWFLPFCFALFYGFYGLIHSHALLFVRPVRMLRGNAIPSKPKSDWKHFSTGVEDVPAIFPALFAMTV